MKCSLDENKENILRFCDGSQSSANRLSASSKTRSVFVSTIARYEGDVKILPMINCINFIKIIEWRLSQLFASSLLLWPTREKVTKTISIFIFILRNDCIFHRSHVMVLGTTASYEIETQRYSWRISFFPNQKNVFVCAVEIIPSVPRLPFLFTLWSPVSLPSEQQWNSKIKHMPELEYMRFFPDEIIPATLRDSSLRCSSISRLGSRFFRPREVFFFWIPLVSIWWQPTKSEEFREWIVFDAANDIKFFSMKIRCRPSFARLSIVFEYAFCSNKQRSTECAEIWHFA